MRITLATLDSFGDLHPFLAIGCGLKARGHDVTLTEPLRQRIKRRLVAVLRPQNQRIKVLPLNLMHGCLPEPVYAKNVRRTFGRQ